MSADNGNAVLYLGLCLRLLCTLTWFVCRSNFQADLQTCDSDQEKTFLTTSSYPPSYTNATDSKCVPYLCLRSVKSWLSPHSSIFHHHLYRNFKRRKVAGSSSPVFPFNVLVFLACKEGTISSLVLSDHCGPCVWSMHIHYAIYPSCYKDLDIVMQAWVAF